MLLLPIPLASQDDQYSLGFLNCFFPGIGVLMLSSEEKKLTQKRQFKNIIIGLTQLLFAPLVIGWIYAIVHGIKINKQSRIIINNWHPLRDTKQNSLQQFW
ncbi:Transmembrane_domain-containing protein [Hexamita inflata]|uniref:Transmembrane domain-containing protein n=1 Tax=Hexamita inflata TaxID=28002 RepID=A0AA86QRB4_9EUKA|nr:Transmembrane domain-containing protein [Hexamita inflata]